MVVRTLASTSRIPRGTLVHEGLVFIAYSAHAACAGFGANRANHCATSGRFRARAEATSGGA